MNDKMVGIKVSEEARAALTDLARERGYKFVSDYVRALLEADAKAHGKDIDLSVDRGGYRELTEETRRRREEAGRE